MKRWMAMVCAVLVATGAWAAREMSVQVREGQLRNRASFLGTVTGMLAAFQAVSITGTHSSQLLAGGISEALITTVVGLAIGIPVFVAYRLLIARSDYLVLEMEKTSARILEYLKGDEHEVQKDKKGQEDFGS